MKFEDIKKSVEELSDGRTLDADDQKRWIKRVRNNVAMDPLIRGFRGLFFLYKEAEVKDGSQANEPRYAVPSDYIIGLNVFYDGNLLSPPPPEMLDVTLSRNISSGTPKWVRLMGQEFDILPPPENTGDSIYLLYNGLPEEISSTDQEDYFMKHFEDLHIFGMGQLANLKYRNKTMADYCTGLFEKEKAKLMLHNRNHYLNTAHIRFINWDEYEDKKRVLFPQFDS